MTRTKLLRATLGTLALAIFALSFGAQAKVYRWVDKDGKVQYSDVPPVQGEVEQKKLVNNKVDTSEPPYETQQAAKASPVTLYVSNDCKTLCDNARNFLKKRKIPFAEKSLNTNEEIEAFIKQTKQKDPGVPSLTVGSKFLDGFETSNWNSALDVAGYPK